MKIKKCMSVSSRRIAALAACCVVAGCERPPIETTQTGYRGLGMQAVVNPRIAAARQEMNQIPVATPAMPAGQGGPLAGTVYKNVQVLGDLPVAEFARLMVAITQWVAPPEQSCNYCHSGDLASDEIYTKVVARRMIQMVGDINSGWQQHVGTTGVTCYTCHRGQAVPAAVWFHNPGTLQGSAFAGNKAGQNAPARSVGLAALPNDPFSAYLDLAGANGANGAKEIRVVSTAALPGTNRTSIKQAELTYGLMMHMSESLGQNCTFCHNSRSFAEWDGSTPQRVTAWYGIRMVRNVNANYLTPLTPTFPASRLGPHGDVAKVSCGTCHQGVSKPLYGRSMLADYPELAVHREIVKMPAPSPAEPAPAATTP